MTMEPLLPNICDFIAHVSPLNTLPADAQNDIARSISISYLAVGETLAFDIAARERYLYIVRTGSLEQRWSDGVLRARLGRKIYLASLFLKAFRVILKIVTTSRRLKTRCCTKFPTAF
ncbi:hypothetical protein ACSPAH_12000 [Buttiauxella agrestis]